MKIAAALPVPVPDHAEPLRVPDSDPDAFLRLWSDLADRAFAGATSEDLRATGGEAADPGLVAGPPAPLSTEAVVSAGEQAPALTAIPLSGQRVAWAESGFVPLRGLSPGRWAQPDPAGTTLAPPVRPASAGSIPAGLLQNATGSAPVDQGTVGSTLKPVAPGDSGGLRREQVSGPTATSRAPAVVAADHGDLPAPPTPAESFSEPFADPGLAEPVAAHGAMSALMAKAPPQQQDSAATSPASVPSRGLKGGALALSPALRDAGSEPALEAALPNRADAMVPGHDRPVPTTPPLSVPPVDSASHSAWPPVNLPGKAGAVAASSTVVSAGSEVLGHKIGSPVSAVPAAHAVQSTGAGSGLIAQPRFRANPPLSGDGPRALEPFSVMAAETPPATPQALPDRPDVRNAPDSAPDVNARAPDIPDTWSLVLARVAGVHARRPSPDPLSASSLPPESGAGRENPEAARQTADASGASQDKAVPLPEPAGRSAGLAVAAPVPAPFAVAGRLDSMPLPSAGPDTSIPSAQEPSVSPIAAVSDTSLLRSDDRRLSLPPDPPPTRQIAEAMRTASGNRVDLTLMPEELGRVTISFRDDGEVLRVHMTADRPETLDLLRRHAPELAAELRAQGYDSQNFFFGRSGRNPSGYAMAGAVADPDAPAADPAPLAPRPPAADGLGTLDLRL